MLKSFALYQGGNWANPRKHTKVCDRGARRKPTPRQREGWKYWSHKYDMG